MSKNNQAVFLTSCKGGAGKTTLSISICCSEALEIAKKSEQCFDEIYYFDIDLYGGASQFILNIKNECYFNNCKSVESITKYFSNIKFDADSIHDASFNCLIIDPALRIKKTYYGDVLNSRIDNSVLDDVLIKNIVKLLKHYNSDEQGKLFVFDCSPGFDEFTRKLSNQVKNIGIRTNVIFTSTYDNSHIEKTKIFFKEYRDTSGSIECDMKIVLIDTLNACNLNDTEYGPLVLKDVMKNIDGIPILQKDFDGNIIKANSYIKQQQFGNNGYEDMYILSSKLREDLLKYNKEVL